METVTILDVGHGNSTIINTNNQICIIDTGESSSLFDYLIANKIHIIDFLFLSHSDKDHIGKAIKLLTTNEFSILNIIVNPDSEKNSDSWNDLIYEIEQQANKGKISLDSGTFDKIFKIGNTQLIVNSPSPELSLKGAGSKTKAGEQITSNTVSMFITVNYKNENIVALAGDIDDIAISHFSEPTKAKLKCKHLVFPHHGGYCGNLLKYEDLINYVSPEFIIFSNGKRFKNNPRPEIIDLIKKCIRIPKILCTELSDLCKDCSEKKECAGNIIIDMETNTIVSPQYTDYETKKKSYLSKSC